ncbi:ANTAR domain-containing protein [Streptomyces sp. B21-105]
MTTSREQRTAPDGTHDATVACLEQENAQLRRAVDSHATVDQAIGVLVATYRLPPTAEFEVLREVSQHTNIQHQTAHGRGRPDRLGAGPAAAGAGGTEAERCGTAAPASRANPGPARVMARVAAAVAEVPVGEGHGGDAGLSSSFRRRSPAGLPAGRRPASPRPAKASPTRSRAWSSRVVNRAYGAGGWKNGRANVRRGQSADPQTKRRTVSRIARPCSASGRTFQPALVTAVDSV